ncbi:MAG: precorrin-6y C5,15-methyltransferase (decarboxylating) subunit CbiE [Methylococcales symbiont of Hymedesmia sp. n. MRB-2018]|nr:MAG: precorrin-6y C5,15-methyltransferase (decarboxylating) subunit CbiE [Methylococcales symbiont of Hymedesmia sp. n. MRB-2018]KAF3982692.1 MAG: precorrin-6y C5,15-methyltransferase (decarboxylating) subunit CbiE [Methylococcales symbiont of Hymedesmia sp. n. MRB-2018]
MRCNIIGVLDNGIQGLTPATLKLIENADLIIASSRTLTLFAEHISHAQQKDLSGHLSQVATWISQAIAQNQHIVVFATGDPLCHGIASYLYKKLPHEQLHVVPNISSIQLAFARMGVAWQDAHIVSVHSKDAGEWSKGASSDHGLYPLLQAIFNHDKLAILTSPDNTPDRIARMMLIANIADQFTISVAENLLSDDERVISRSNIESIAEQNFNGNNIVILQRQQKTIEKIIFGVQDSDFLQRKPDKGLITKREVRAVSLARMQLKTHSIVWDIGAGSGAVGLEAARICSHGYVYAVEKNSADFEIASTNAENFEIYNYHLINNKAPLGMESWPKPDAVFIGGTGGELAPLISLCLQQLNTDGWLVMNFVTVENLATAIETLKKQQAVWDITQLQASRSQAILNMNRLKAENPVWIVSAQRQVL